MTTQELLNKIKDRISVLEDLKNQVDTLLVLQTRVEEPSFIVTMRVDGDLTDFDLPDTVKEPIVLYVMEETERIEKELSGILK